MERDERTLLRLASPLILGRGLSALASFAIPVVLARGLDPSAYGTYKQFFLVASTSFLIGQLGLPASLYFFIPRTSDSTGRGQYATGAVLTLVVSGLVAAAVVYPVTTELARRFDNPALAELAWPLTIYSFLTLGAAPLEIVLTASGRTRSAALAYVLSDLTRMAALVFPVYFGLGLGGLAWMAVGFASIRVVAMWLVLGSIGTLALPARSAWLRQLGYALPFGAAVLLSVLQQQLPQYAVSALTDAATFAVFAVGALQIPLTDTLYTPIAEIMMVRLAAKGPKEAPVIFREAVAQLAVFFVPLAAFAWAIAPELIPTLYTAKYQAAVPIFLVASSEVLLSALPVDGLLRALDQTRTIFFVGGIRLVVALFLVPLGLSWFGLLGAIAGHVITQYVAKLLLLWAAARRLEVGVDELLPAPRLLSWAIRAFAIFAAIFALRRVLVIHGWTFILATSIVAITIWLTIVLISGELKSPRAAEKEANAAVRHAG